MARLLRAKKLLVASVGVATLSYACSGGGIVGNCCPPNPQSDGNPPSTGPDYSDAQAVNLLGDARGDDASDAGAADATDGGDASDASVQDAAGEADAPSDSGADAPAVD